MQIPGRRFMKDDKVYTDWIPRGGDNVILRADRVASNPPANGSNGVTVTIRVFTKNSDEVGNGHAVEPSGSSTPVSFTVTFTDTTVKQLIVNSTATSAADHPKGLEQLVRLELVATGTSDEDWIVIRLLAPVFFNAAS